MLDLTNVKKQINNVKKSLFLPETANSVKFIKLSKVLLVIEDGWYLDKNPEREESSPEYHLLSITDSDNEYDLLKIVPMSTSIKIGDLEYPTTQFFKKLDGMRIWELKLQTALLSAREDL